MPVKCPGCQADVPDVVPTATMTERLRAKDDAIKLKDEAFATAQAEAATLKTKAAAADSATAEATTWRQKHDALLEGTARAEALGLAGVAKERQAGFVTMYNAAIAGKADADRPTFADWLAGDAKADPFLAPHFTIAETAEQKTAREAAAAAARETDPAKKATAEAAAATAKKAAADAAAAAASAAAAGRATEQAGSAKKWSDKEVADYLASPEYRKLPVADQRKEAARVRAEAKASNSPAV